MRSVLLELCAGNPSPSIEDLTEPQQRWLQRLIWRSQAAIDLPFPAGTADENETLRSDLQRACGEVDAGTDNEERYQTIEQCLESLAEHGIISTVKAQAIRLKYLGVLVNSLTHDVHHYQLRRL